MKNLLCSLDCGESEILFLSTKLRMQCLPPHHPPAALGMLIQIGGTGEKEKETILYHL